MATLSLFRSTRPFVTPTIGASYTVLLGTKGYPLKKALCGRRQSSSVTSPASLNVKETAKVVTQPPLAVLPTSVLLRSLFLNFVSSKPYLLRPSLSILSYLAKPNNGFLFNVGKNPVLRWVLKRTFYAQYCAGENAAEVRANGARMKQMGVSGTLLTYAKETVFDHNSQAESGVESKEFEDSVSIEEWRKGTLETVEMLGPGDQLALKLSGAGPWVTGAFAARELAPKPMLEALDDICIASRKRQACIVVDAESQHFQHGIARTSLELMRKYNNDGYSLVYNTYQAYLKDTPKLLNEHMEVAAKEGWTLGLKVVRGAYIASDDRSLIHDTKENTDNAYNRIAQGALLQKLGEFGTSKPFPLVNLLLATHNKDSAITALQLYQERVRAGLPTVPVQFAQLQGMSDEVTFSLLQTVDGNGEPPKVLKCSTWGSLGECMAYLLRRAIENRDAVSRTNDEYDALTKEWRRRLW